MASTSPLADAFNHENICSLSNLVNKSEEKQTDPSYALRNEEETLKTETVLNAGIQLVVNDNNGDTTFENSSPINFSLTNERSSGANDQCVNCNKSLSGGTAVRNIARIKNASCSGYDNNDAVSSPTNIENLSVMAAMNIIFNLHRTPVTDREDVLCELCGKFLELAYNAFHDFILLSKSGSVVQYKMHRYKEKSENKTCSNRFGKYSNRTKATNKRSQKVKRLSKLQQKNLQITGENRKCSKKKMRLSSTSPLIETNQTVSKQIQATKPSPPIKTEISPDINSDKDEEKTETLIHKCTICNIEFDDEKFYAHLKTHEELNLHKELPDMNAKKDKVNNTTSSQTKAKVKQVKKIRPEKLTLFCHVCGKKFLRPDHLKLHVRIHTGEKPHSCKLCGKNFSDPRGLSYHEITHSDERPYCCTICGLTFKRLHHLKDHEKNHTDVPRPFTCPICGKAFKHKKHLNSHSVIHQGSKQHQCDICFKMFNRKDNLRQHVKTVHEKDPLEKASKKRNRKALLSSGTELISTSCSSSAIGVSKTGSSTNVNVVPIVTTTATSLTIPVTIHIPDHEQIVYMHL